MNKFEQLSALIDGELGDQDAARILANFDSTSKQTWDEFNLVGDALRASELIDHHDQAFMVNFAAALAKEPVVVAPSLRTAEDRQASGQKGRWLGAGFGRNMAASVAAVALFSFGMYSTVPPLDSEVQMVKTANLKNVSADDLALWQDYLMAHQQNSMRSGLAGVAPMARTDFDNPVMGRTERVVATSSNARDWMNVWEPSGSLGDQNVRFTYVSSHQ